MTTIKKGKAGLGLFSSRSRSNFKVDVYKKDMTTFCSQVSLACVHWIVDSAHVFWRLFWVVGVGAAVILTVYFLSGTIANYLNPSEPYTTNSVNMRIDADERGEVELPHFAFCLTKPWHVDKAKANDVSPEMLSYISNVLVSVSYAAINDPDEWLRLEEAYSKTLLTRFSNNLTHMLESITFSCHDVVQHCKMGSQLVTAEDCCDDYFNTGTYVPNGKCFSTWGKPKHKLLVPYMAFGPRVTVKLHTQSHSELIPRVGSESLSQVAQLLVGVINRLDDMYRIAEQGVITLADTINGIAVQQVSIDMTNIKSDIDMYRGKNINAECGSKETHDNYDSADGFFSYEACFMSVLQGFYKKTLNCYHYVMLHPKDDTPYCSPYQIKHILHGVLTFKSAELPKALSSCPQSCQFTKFETSVSTIPANSEEGDLTSFVVYYKSFDFIKISYNGKRIEEFIGIIGGNMGIFCGACLLTLVELVMFICQGMAKLTKDYLGLNSDI